MNFRVCSESASWNHFLAAGNYRAAILKSSRKNILTSCIRVVNSKYNKRNSSQNEVLSFVHLWSHNFSSQKSQPYSYFLCLHWELGSLIHPHCCTYNLSLIGQIDYLLWFLKTEVWSAAKDWSFTVVFWRACLEIDHKIQYVNLLNIA